MKLICECGNEFDFGDENTNSEGGELSGFEIETGTNENNEDYLLINCKKCNSTLVMYGENEESNE